MRRSACEIAEDGLSNQILFCVLDIRVQPPPDRWSRVAVLDSIIGPFKLFRESAVHILFGDDVGYVIAMGSLASVVRMVTGFYIVWKQSSLSQYHP